MFENSSWQLNVGFFVLITARLAEMSAADFTGPTE
jgi:hypothetical protein